MEPKTRRAKDGAAMEKLGKATVKLIDGEGGTFHDVELFDSGVLRAFTRATYDYGTGARPHGVRSVPTDQTEYTVTYYAPHAWVSVTPEERIGTGDFDRIKAAVNSLNT